MWQPGWEKSLGENEHLYMYDRVPLLSTCSYHKIVNQLYSNIKYRFKSKEVKAQFYKFFEMGAVH